MKIFSKNQIYKGDQLTAKKQNISSTELMERAGTQIFNWMHVRMQGAQVPIHVFCGIGNNGGDGLVVARHLINHGYNVHTYIVNCSDKRSPDFLVNYDRIKQVTKKWPTMMNCEDDFPSIHKDDVIIDAVFGIGLNRPANEWVQKLFQHFKNSEAFVLSIDIPSGVYTDKAPENDEGVVWAKYTLSFQSPKLVFFLPETAKFSEQWEVLNIGIDPEFLSSTETDYELNGKLEVLQIYKPREKFSHKGNYGHAMIMGGSYGKIGSVVLASKAALHAGAGLVSTYIPKCGYTVLQTAFPEGMVITDESENAIANIKYDIEPTVIGCGMGMGTDAKTMVAFEEFLKETKNPLVIDADGLNMLSEKKVLIKSIPENSVLTPHPKELERLIGKWSDDFEKLKKAKAFSKKNKLIIVIKGANTIVIYNNKGFINSTGNQGMATGGSGDVLTGIISGMISQGYEPLHAAVFGVYLHGKSGDIAVEKTGYQSLIASDLIDNLGKAFLDIFAQPNEKTKEENSTKESPRQDSKKQT